ncbi:MAG TPA: hypothetical protein VFH00_01435 [Candidatus Nitrosotalea sp.]|nr:hypothetical protein [Candidatus Nitrosotalea sp.]
MPALKAGAPSLDDGERPSGQLTRYQWWSRHAISITNINPDDNAAR